MLTVQPWLHFFMVWYQQNYPYLSGLLHWHCMGQSYNGPLTRYVKLQVAHAPGMPGTFSPPPRVRDPDMHHGTCVTHVPWCMSGSLNSGFFWSQWRGKCSRHSRHMRNPHFYVSGKRPMALVVPVKQISLLKIPFEARNNWWYNEHNTNVFYVGCPSVWKGKMTLCLDHITTISNCRILVQKYSSFCHFF